MEKLKDLTNKNINNTKVYKNKLISDNSCTPWINIWRYDFVCFGVFSGISTFVGYLMPNPYSSISNRSIWNISVLHTKTVRFQAVQFTISTQFKCQKSYFNQFILACVQFSSILLLDRTLSGATTPD